MSRSKNKHNKRFNTAQREAKFWSKKNRRVHGARLVNAIEKAEDPDDVEMPTDLPKDAGKGNLWIYD